MDEDTLEVTEAEQRAWAKKFRPKSALEHVAWVGEYRKCELCGENTVDILDRDSLHEDESGLYHYDCWETESRKEAEYYFRLYNSQKGQPQVDDSNAYEWGDPKNPAYMEWVFDQADNRRKGV